MDRLPPFSEEAERAVLGCVLLAPEDAGQMLAKIHRSDFYDLRHKEIFSACVFLHADGKSPDTLLVTQWLKDQNKLDGVGGLAYVSDLPDFPCLAAGVSPANVLILGTCRRDAGVPR